MLEALLALGLLFWVGAAAVVITVCICLEYDRYFWPFLILLTGVAAFEFLYEPSTLDAFQAPSLKEMLTNIVIFVGKYLGIGLVWCLPKWFFKMKNHKEEVRIAHEEFLADDSMRKDRESGNPGDVFRKTSKERLWNFLNNRNLLSGSSRYSSNNDIDITLRARDHWQQIGSWIVYWPFSMLNTFFSDLIKWMYYLVRDVLDIIAEKYFRSLNEELNKNSEPVWHD